MKKVILIGYGYGGVGFYLRNRRSSEYEIIGIADNAPFKIGHKVGNHTIMSVDECTQDVPVIIASTEWYEIKKQLDARKVQIEGIVLNEKFYSGDNIGFKRIDVGKDVFLYAGDIMDPKNMNIPNIWGLSITKADNKHVLQDVSEPYDLPNNSVCSYYAEDVLEHIPLNRIKNTIREIYRVLKPGGIFRLSLPDYNSPLLNEISMKDKQGNIIFDPCGGGRYDGVGIYGGHVWFPTYALVRDILYNSPFKDIKFCCYWDETFKLHRDEINEMYGYVNRVCQEMGDDDITNLVVDCKK